MPVLPNIIMQLSQNQKKRLAEIDATIIAVNDEIKELKAKKQEIKDKIKHKGNLLNELTVELQQINANPEAEDDKLE